MSHQVRLRPPCPRLHDLTSMTLIGQLGWPGHPAGTTRVRSVPTSRRAARSDRCPDRVDRVAAVRLAPLESARNGVTLNVNPVMKRRLGPSSRNSRPDRRAITDVLVVLIRVAGEVLRQWIERGGRL